MIVEQEATRHNQFPVQNAMDGVHLSGNKKPVVLEVDGIRHEKLMKLEGKCHPG
jgi:hypothetical protein